MSSSPTPQFQAQLMSLVRAFGLHRPGQTPCGQPVAVAEAHALIELSAQQVLSQNELATRLRLEKSTVSRLVKKMCDRNWITPIRSDADRRIVELSLTSVGQQAAEKLAIARQQKFEQILSNIPENRQADVLDALKILVEAMGKSD
ncbi:MAG: MarR family winged helix-turn-helix transcriptional regulator [Cyanobacteria bacterium J06634_5]